MNELTNDQINVKAAELRGYLLSENPDGFVPDDRMRYCVHKGRVLRCKPYANRFAPKETPFGQSWSNYTPATCANAAMDLVEVMRAKGLKFRCDNMEDTFQAAFFEPYGPDDISAEAATLPLAISKAFIAANEGRDG